MVRVLYNLFNDIFIDLYRKIQYVKVFGYVIDNDNIVSQN